MFIERIHQLQFGVKLRPARRYHASGEKLALGPRTREHLAQGVARAVKTRQVVIAQIEIVNSDMAGISVDRGTDRAADEIERRAGGLVIIDPLLYVQNKLRLAFQLDARKVFERLLDRKA